MTELKAAASKLGLSDIAEPEEDRDTLLQLLFSVGVENKIGQDVPALCTTSLRHRRRSQNQSSRSCVADRFEVYFKG